MQKYSLEFFVGLFVLAGVLCLGWLTVKLGKMEVFANDGYTVTAGFASAAGLRSGASVEIAGVQVGKVTGITLDERYYAEVTMQLQKAVKLSEDSIASIKTSGIIGDKYINISLGGAPEEIEPNGRIEETESAVDLEALISKYVFGGVK